MNLGSLLTSLALIVLSVSATFVPPPSWENIRYERTIDLLKSYMKERHTIEIKNIEQQPISTYFFSVPTYIKDDISLFIALIASSHSSENQLLDAKEVKVEEETGEDEESSGFTYYEIELPYPISPKSTIEISVSYITTNQLSPLPPKLPMGSDQTLLLKSTKLPLSAYDTTNYELRIIGVDSARELPLDSPEFENEQKDYQFTIKGNAIVYGPYDRTRFNKFTNLPLVLLFGKQTPLPYIYNLTRDVWISHWSGKLQFEEYYELSNKAVQLDSGFSRVDWMTGKYTMRPSPVLTSIQMPLPKDILTDEIYFTDKVGNVSTSVIIENELLLKPRFPIFGNWNYNFTVGWTNPLSSYLHSSPSGEHVLKIPLLAGLHDATYENVQLSVLLPEGARLTSIETPLGHIRKETQREYSYLDFGSGHEKVTLSFSNLVDEMKGLDVLVWYEYTVLDMLWKPLTCSFYIFAALMSLYALRLVDLSIKPKDKEDAAAVDQKN